MEKVIKHATAVAIKYDARFALLKAFIPYIDYDTGISARYAVDGWHCLRLKTREADMRWSQESTS